MDRLSIRNGEGVAYFKGEKLRLEPCEMDSHQVGEVLRKLAEYEDLEEQGRLLKLPISEDRPVYSIEYCCGNNNSNKSGLCIKGYCKNCAEKDYFIKVGIARHCTISEINKSVFLTKEEAEAKLKEMRGSND